MQVCEYPAPPESWVEVLHHHNPNSLATQSLLHHGHIEPGQFSMRARDQGVLSLKHRDEARGERDE